MYLDGARLDLGTPKQRALVAALALVRTAGQRRRDRRPAVGRRAATRVTATLQAYVSGLRKVLEPPRAPRTRNGARHRDARLRTAPAGAVIDVATFEQDVAEVHRLLTNPDPGRADLEQAVTTLDRSLARWTGQAYAELGDAPAAVAEQARLDETRLVAVEDRAVAQLALASTPPSPATWRR